MEKLADHYVDKRNVTREQEIKKILHIEWVRKIAAKHRWYLKGTQGMLQRILVQDFFICRMFLVYTSIALLASIGLTSMIRLREEDFKTSVFFL